MSTAGASQTGFWWRGTLRDDSRPEDEPEDELDHNTSRQCECGRPKDYEAQCCRRCGYLDFGYFRGGHNPTKPALIIAALRNYPDGLTLTELCQAISTDSSHANGKRGMLRTVQGLMRVGRVRRYWRDGDVELSEYVWVRDRAGRVTGKRAARPGEEATVYVNRSGGWVYVLDGKTEAGR